MHVVPYRGANFGVGGAHPGQASSLGRGQRYRQDYNRVDHNRPPSLNLASLQKNFSALWDRTKRKVEKAYNIVYAPEPPEDYRVQEADETEMGTLELSLRYPTGVHIGVEPDTHQYNERLMEDDHDDDTDDVWTLLSMMHAMMVVTIVIVLDTAQIFLRYSDGQNAVTPAHVEGFFIMLYLIAIAWILVVVVLKRPLPSSDDEERTDAEAGSRYLYVGLLFFGTGSCLWMIMRTATYIELSGKNCGNQGVFACGNILCVAFTMLQIYYFWRFSKYCLVRWKPVAKLAVMHLMATNAALCVRTLVEETWEDFLLDYLKSSMTKGDGGYTGKLGHLVSDSSAMGHGNLYSKGYSYNGTFNNTGGYPIDPCYIGKTAEGLSGAVYKASVFLYSFTIEYTIIAGAMAYIMWQNIGRKVHHPHKEPSNRQFNFSFECGLLVGVLCTMCGVIILILNIIYLGDYEKRDQSFMSYRGYRVFLNIVCIVACVGAFIGIHKGGWQQDHHSGPAHRVDAALLLICVSGSLLQSTYTFVAAVSSLSQIHSGLVFFDDFTHIIQTVLQCVLILDAMHRKPPADFRHTRTKQLLMFLLVSNITWWLISTYELKGGYDLYALENGYYGATSWYVIVHLAAPLEILFRFHSTACFFEVWNLPGVEANGGHHH
ncbi:otopetrin-2-like [Acanthaster planci]|uniref:Otopetrin-2-like n=1 Tax=Acanthaster planci TaxID=133434 RepID=A0A8B7ZHV5_ACAPL|nr:otopetrin-2-like [Acanthaster planci]